MADTTNATDAFDVAVLQNLLASPALCLTTKRALACVTKLGSELTNEHMGQTHLYVDSEDCTAINARWILRQLISRVPGLLVCARGELLAPEMNLQTLMQFKRVRVKGLVMGKECVMTPTAAYFLGHALSEGFEVDPYVRLTTGKKKRIQALRVNTRLFLTPEETFKLVDQRIMSGALLANAESRLEVLKRHDARLSFTMLELDDVTAADLGEQLRRAIVSGSRKGLPISLDLSHNRFGKDGLRALLSPAYGPKGPVPHAHFMEKLDLTGVLLGCSGVKRLANVLAVGRLNVVEELVLVNVGMRWHGVTALVDTYAELSKQAMRGLGMLESLDLSENPLGPRDLEPLLEVDAFPHLETLKLCNIKVSATFWIKLGRAIVKENRFPLIQHIGYRDNTDNAGTVDVDTPLCTAVGIACKRRALKKSEEGWHKWEERQKAQRAHEAMIREQVRQSRAVARDERKAQLSERRMDRAPSLPPSPHYGLTDDEDEQQAVADHDFNLSTLDGPSDAPNSMA